VREREHVRALGQWRSIVNTELISSEVDGDKLTLTLQDVGRRAMSIED